MISKYVITQVVKSVVERATISLINTITVSMNEYTTALPTCTYFGGWVVGRLIRMIIYNYVEASFHVKGLGMVRSTL